MLLAGLALASMVLGLVRDRTTAGVFGSSPDYDAFVIAQTIPMLVLHIFLGGAVTSAFVPRFLSRLQQEGPAEAWRFTHSIALLVASTGLLFSVGVWTFAENVVDVVGPGLLPQARDLAIETTQALALALPFLVLSTLSAAVLNAHECFAAPGARPLTNNIILLGFLFTVASQWGIDALVWAFVIGAVAQWLIQLPQLWPLVRPHVQWPRVQAEDVNEFLRRFVPIFFMHLCLQGFVLVDRRFSTEAHTSGASLFAYAERFLNYSRMAIAGSLGVVILPRLSSLFAAGEDANDLIGKAFGVVGLLTIPAGFALALYGESFVGLLLQTGQFTAGDTVVVGRALLGLSPAVFFLGLVFLLDRVFIAQNRLWLWVLFMGIGLIINVGLKAAFTPQFGLLAVGGASSTGYALTSLLGVGWLVLRAGPRSAVFGRGLQDIVIVSGSFAVAFALPLLLWRLAGGLPESMAIALMTCGLSTVVGTAALLLLNPPTVAFFRDKLREKFSRSR